MAENELQKLIKGIFSRIKEEHGYTDEQALIYLKGYEGCAEEHQQSLEKRDKMLRDAVAELVEAKRLLRLAVEDITFILSYACSDEEMCCEECPTVNHACNKWRYADEALKLIGGSEK